MEIAARSFALEKRILRISAVKIKKKNPRKRKSIKKTTFIIFKKVVGNKELCSRHFEEIPSIKIVAISTSSMIKKVLLSLIGILRREK